MVERIEEVYEVLSLCPANGVMAVYADDVEGGYELRPEPLTHIAVASCIEKIFEDGHLVDELKHNTVVGVDFSEGYMQICNDAANFAGLLEPGQDIYKATGGLRGRYLQLRLIKKTPQ
jgi:hypothetical protein